MDVTCTTGTYIYDQACSKAELAFFRPDMQAFSGATNTGDPAHARVKPRKLSRRRSPG